MWGGSGGGGVGVCRLDLEGFRIRFGIWFRARFIIRDLVPSPFFTIRRAFVMISKNHYVPLSTLKAPNHQFVKHAQCPNSVLTLIMNLPNVTPLEQEFNNQDIEEKTHIFCLMS